jgi:hypothetical protein
LDGENGEKMVDEELDYLDELERLISKKEERVKRLRIILFKETENIEKEQNVLNNVIKKERTEENPLKVKEYASEVIKMGKTRYEMIYALKAHIKGEVFALSLLKEEIETKKVLSIRSYSNEEKVTEREKEKDGGGENE